MGPQCWRPQPPAVRIFTSVGVAQEVQLRQGPPRQCLPGPPSRVPLGLFEGSRAFEATLRCGSWSPSQPRGGNFLEGAVRCNGRGVLGAAREQSPTGAAGGRSGWHWACPGWCGPHWAPAGLAAQKLPPAPGKRLHTLPRGPPQWGGCRGVAAATDHARGGRLSSHRTAPPMNRPSGTCQGLWAAGRWTSWPCVSWPLGHWWRLPQELSLRARPAPCLSLCRNPGPLRRPP